MVKFISILAVAIPVLPFYLSQCWTESDYSHCLLVPLIAGYIAYQKSKQNGTRISTPSVLARIAVGLLALCHIVGVASASSAFLARILLVGLIIAAVWTDGRNSFAPFVSISTILLVLYRANNLFSILPSGDVMTCPRYGLFGKQKRDFFIH